MSKFTYVYSDNCPPCRLVTPVIDTFLTMDDYDLEKIQYSEYIKANPNNALSTPALIDNETNKIYSGELAPLAQLSITHPKLLNKNLPQYLKEILTNNEKKVDE